MYIRKSADGHYYVFQGKKKLNDIRFCNNIFLVKSTGTCGIVNKISAPKELVGKRIILRVEVLE